jgi:hypothetical protein
MSRNVDSFLEKPMPPVGKIEAVCLDAKVETSKTKHTPYVRLTWESPDCQFNWTDDIFCTVKAIRRVALVAKHVCGFNGELPDNNDDALGVLTDFIVANAIGKRSIVTIEEKSEIYIPETGPDMGRKKEIMKKRVAFSGYAKPEATVPVDEGEKKETKKEEVDQLPF